MRIVLCALVLFLVPARAEESRVATVKWHARVPGATALALMESPPHYLISADEGGKLGVWDSKSGERIYVWSSFFGGHNGAVLSLVGDSRWIVSGGADGALKWWDAALGKPVKTADGHKGESAAGASQFTRCSFSPPERRQSGDRFYYTKAKTQCSIGVAALASNSAAERLASGGGDKLIKLWKDRKLSSDLSGHAGAILALAFSPDGGRLVSGSTDQTARVWHAETGQLFADLRGHTARISAVAFSADGRRVYTASADRTIRAWDAETGVAISVWDDHQAPVLSITVSDDGSRLLSGDDNGVLIVRDTVTGGALASWQAHSGAVVAGKFLSSESVVSVGADGVMVRFDLPANLAARLVQSGPPAVPSPPVSVGVKELDVVRSEKKKPAALPVGRSHADDFAVIVGIEKYQDLVQADYGERDAAAVRDVLQQLGVPEENVILLAGARATRTAIAKYLEEWLPRNVTAESRVYFYFSGHGAPGPKAESYLVPWDGDPAYLQSSGYPLSRLYSVLQGLRAKEVIAFLDSCFSGAGGRSVIAAGTRPLVSVVTPTLPATSRVAVLTAASSAEIAGSAPEQQHGLFTYFVLKGLAGEARDGTGHISLSSLHEYVRKNVQRAARRQNREQTPELHAAKRSLVVR